MRIIRTAAETITMGSKIPADHKKPAQSLHDFQHPSSKKCDSCLTIALGVWGTVSYAVVQDFDLVQTKTKAEQASRSSHDATRKFKPKKETT